jgi:hypothetical protein
MLTPPHPRRREPILKASVVAFVALLALSGVLIATRSGGGRAAASAKPGSTLLHAFADRDGDGVLTLGRGEPLVDRTDLAASSPVKRVLVTFAQISDIHVTDEESPLRIEPVDRFGGSLSSAFRPQESLTTQVLAATELSVNALRPSFVFVTGDLTDNAQRNELSWTLRILHGGTVRPDSGSRGYDGAQAASSADPFLYRPAIDAPRHPGLLAAAQQPFRAPGLKEPWLPLVSNHDLLVQGVVPADRTLEQVAVGSRRLVALSPEALRQAESGTLDRTGLERLLVGDAAGRYVPVPADPARRPYTPRQALHAIATASHVSLVGGRFVWVRTIAPGIVAIGLDTAIRTGGASGALPAAELAWLGRQLAAQQRKHIFIVSPTPLEDTRGGPAALALLDHTKGIVAVLAGDTHRSKITPHHRYWLVRAPSLADYPQQARAYRLVQLENGGLALETWMLDHAGSDGAPGYLGLAGISRDLSYLDPQGGRPKHQAGTRLDRNARLFLP